MSADECNYRLNIQKNLKEYLDIWSLVDNLWHIKPLQFQYMNSWKSNQEKEMFSKKGSALKDKQLSNFLRMLNVSLPHESFDEIESHVLLMINKDRTVKEVRLNL